MATEETNQGQMAERRMEGVRLLEKGSQSQAEIARVLGVSEAAVCVLAKKLRKHGKDGLKAKKASGRPPRLTKKDKAALLKKMKSGSIAAGFETERWTQSRVQALIAKEFGIHYHPNYISRLLHDLGWSVQQPETRAMERDEELIRAWLSKDWNRIKKARRLGAEVIIEDEFGISFSEMVSMTWTPRGQTPHLKRLGKYRREISTMAGLTITGKIYKKHFEGSINSEKMIQGLDDIHVEFLPAHAPEVNPEEFCHGNVKRSIKNAVFQSKQEIRQKLNKHFAALRKCPDVLLACFHHTGLNLNQLW